MYDNQFYTCPLGAIQLIGDEPVKSTQNRIGADQAESIDLEKDFQRDMRLFANLVKEVETIKHHLDALHTCTRENVCGMDDLEDRMSAFFGVDQSKKRMLSSRVVRTSSSSIGIGNISIGIIYIGSSPSSM
ncbi:hypothetical protein LPJ59_003057 [Coemansia sp. RSA 2399]|nr:hypothetical protein LPJ59_003057 [Coemansia sp. RSA 2399]